MTARPAPAASAEFSLSRSEGRLAWIFGSSRSGSTWLLRMLSELDRTVPIDDPHLGHHLGVWRPIALAWATADGTPELDLLSEIKRDHDDYFFSDRYREDWMPPLRQLIQRRFDAQIRDHLRRRPTEDPIVVVKEPGSHVADWLAQMFPRSRIIFLLRDGRDVVDSWLDAHRNGSWGTRNGQYPVSRDGRLALIRWQATVWLYRTEVVQRAFAAHDPERRVLLRYEDLRAEPRRELARVTDVFGFSPTEEQLDRVVEQHAFDRIPGRRKGAGRFIRRARPGGWREHMDAEEIAAMHEVLGGKLVELGYLDQASALAA